MVSWQCSILKCLTGAKFVITNTQSNGSLHSNRVNTEHYSTVTHFCFVCNGEVALYHHNAKRKFINKIKTTAGNGHSPNDSDEQIQIQAK